jgi:hypothetical protein
MGLEKERKERRICRIGKLERGKGLSEVAGIWAGEQESRDFEDLGFGVEVRG